MATDATHQQATPIVNGEIGLPSHLAPSPLLGRLNQTLLRKVKRASMGPTGERATASKWRTV